MNTTKICTKCNIEKSIEEFNNGKIYKDGKTPSCKLCIKESKQLHYLKNKTKIKTSVKKYSESNKDVIKAKKKEYYINNKIKINDKNKKYNDKNKEELNKKRILWYQNNREIIKLKSKEWLKNNKDKQKLIKQKYTKKRKEKDPLFKLTENIRSMVCNSLAKQNYTKKSKTHEILGCSYEEFKEYLETLWEPWMNWDNRGLYNGELNHGWDIDHIIPLSTAKSEDDVIRLNHYSNLQPLCSYVNRVIKKDNLIL
jgi:hypothetical protein